MLVYGNGTISGPKLAFLKLLGALIKLHGGTLTEADVKKVLGDPKGEYRNFSSQPDDPSTMGTIADEQVFDYQQGHTSNGTFGFRLSSAAGKGNVPQDSNANSGINPAHPNRNARVVEGAFIHAARAGAPSAENYVAGSNGCVVGKYSSFFSDLQASPTGATGRFVIFR